MMWYGNPREARRAARHAARAARYTARNARWGARYGYGYRYRRPGRGIIGLPIVLFLLLFVVPHTWSWLIMGVIALAVIGLVLGAVRANMRNSSMPYQPPPAQQPYVPYAGPPPQNSTYDQGYAAQQPRERYTEGEQPYYTPPQVANEQLYEQPQAQYPEQMPPMQQ